MLQRAAVLCTLIVTTYSQSPFGGFGGGGPPPSYSSGGPPSSYSSGGPPPSYSSGGPPPSFGSGGPPPSFSSGGPPPSFSSGGPPYNIRGSPSSSPFGSGGPPSSSFLSGGPSPFSSDGPQSPFSSGGPSGRPGSRPSSFPKGPKKSSSPGLFSWIGSTMSKLQGLGPKITYHSTKPKPPQHGGPSSGSPPQNSPYFSSGGPPREFSSFPPKSSPFFEGGSSPYSSPPASFASPNSIDHPPVVYRNPSGPPSSSFGSRPGPPPSYTSSRPLSLGSRRPPSFGPEGPSPYSSSSFSSSRPSFGGPSPFSPSQGDRNNLDVFPSQQISYQSEVLSQNEPGFGNGLGSLQSLYASQSGKPSYSPYEQQSSFSHNQPQQTKRGNYGATFQTVEPVRVAPIYDIGNQQSSDMSGAGSGLQQSSNIHDTPFATIVNDYAAHADAVTSGSEQMMQASSDMATAASSHKAIPGQMHILGQTNEAGNPVFEVVADANAPTYNGHPVDLSKLISMIEPGAQIDTMNNYGDTDMGGSEQQPMYAEAPNSDPSMMSGNKNFASRISHTVVNNFKVKSSSASDNLHAASSESKVTILKPDGTEVTNDELIKEEFDKDIILNDDLQESKGEHGFIIMTDHNDEPRHDDNDQLNGILQQNFTMTETNKNDDKTYSFKNETDDELLAVVQQLRNSASSALLNRFINDSRTFVVAIPNSENITIDEQLKSMHPNHNYHGSLTRKLEDKNETDHDTKPNMNLPVINTFLDNVQPNSFDDSAVDATNDRVSDLSKMFEDYDSDEMVPGDSEGDLDAAGSRNVKSVAIIVTPPPNYVRIKNKYQKMGTPLSALTSTTPSTEVFSEVSVNRESSQSSSDHSVSSEPMQPANIEETPNAEMSSKVVDVSREGHSLIESSSTTVREDTKPTRRYPVYRGNKKGSA